MKDIIFHFESILRVLRCRVTKSWTQKISLEMQDFPIRSQYFVLIETFYNTKHDISAKGRENASR